jgi:hypothetical protein
MIIELQSRLKRVLRSSTLAIVPAATFAITATVRLIYPAVAQDIGAWDGLGTAAGATKPRRRPSLRCRTGSAARAPRISIFRRYLLPRLVIPSRRGFSS